MTTVEQRRARFDEFAESNARQIRAFIAQNNQERDGAWAKEAAMCGRLELERRERGK